MFGRQLLVFSDRDPLAAALASATAAWECMTTVAATVDELRAHLAAGRHDMVLVESAAALRALLAGGDGAADSMLTLAELEKRHILQVLAAHANNRSRAAAALGIDKKTLYNKLKSYESASAVAQRRQRAKASPNGDQAASPEPGVHE